MFGNMNVPWSLPPYAAALKLSHNLYFDLTLSHRANRNWTPNFVVYTLDEFRT